MEQSIKKIFSHIGEDVSRSEISLTPARMIEGYKNIFSGYSEEPSKIIGNVFSHVETNDIILFEKIDFFSTCEHHFIPFFGKIQVAYIPNKNVIGFSRVTLLVSAITRRMQIQERIAFEISNILQNSLLKPEGVFVKIEGNHFCHLAKEKTSSPLVLKNICTTGSFKSQENIQKLQLMLA